MPTKPDRHKSSHTGHHGTPALRVPGLLERVAELTEDEALKMLSTPGYDTAPVLVKACCTEERPSQLTSRRPPSNLDQTSE